MIPVQIQDSTHVDELFATVNGVRVHYRRAGQGPPLLLIHGLVGSALNWRLNIEELAKDATVYAIDLLNMGQSDRVPGLDAGLEATAVELIRWMQVVGLERVDVAGHSHGGAVAMMLAAQYPERVGKLILFAPANPFCDLGRQLIAFYKTRPGHMLARLIPVLPTFIKATALGRMYGDPSRATRASLEGYTAGLAKPGSVDHVLQIVQRWYADMALLRTALTRLATRPVLLIWGDRDRAVGLSSAHQLRESMPHSELLVIPGVGHIAFEEMPDICNRAMREWLAPSTGSARFSMRYPTESLQHLEAV